MAQMVAIPHLAEGQKVKDWRRNYAAATGLFTEQQQIALIPMYAGRTEGEIDIAHICATQKTINEALDELEKLIDGSPSRMLLMNRVFDAKPSTRDFAGLTSFFFELKNEAAGAGIANGVMFVRFLNFVPNGDKFYRQNEATITDDIGDAELLEMFKKLQTKMIQNNRDATEVKQEKDGFVFTANEVVPQWAEELKKEIGEIRGKIDEHKEDDDSQGNDDVYYGQDERRKFRGRCYICNKVGHLAATCYQRKCRCCGGIGHDASRCTSKGKPGNDQRRKSQDGKRPL